MICRNCLGQVVPTLSVNNIIRFQRHGYLTLEGLRSSMLDYIKKQLRPYKIIYYTFYIYRLKLCIVHVKEKIKI